MEGLISEFYGSFSMGFKYGRIPAVTRILNEISVNFLVSASNKLGKVWEETEEENLVSVVKIVKGTEEDSGRLLFGSSFACYFCLVCISSY